MLTNLLSCRLRELGTSEIGRLVSVTGVVTRTSEVRPELLQGTFKCLECGGVIKNVEQQFKYTEVIKRWKLCFSFDSCLVWSLSCYVNVWSLDFIIIHCYLSLTGYFSFYFTIPILMLYHTAANNLHKCYSIHELFNAKFSLQHNTYLTWL